MAVRFIDHTPIRVVKSLMDEAKKTNIGITSRHQLLYLLVESKQTNLVIPTIIENRFITAEKPFFNLYPKVAESLAKTSLNIRPKDIQESIIHQLPAIAIRLAKGSKEAIVSETEWFIISVFSGTAFDLMNTSGIALNFFGCNRPFIAIYHECSRACRLSTVPLDSMFDEKDFPDTGPDGLDLKLLCRITLGVMLLASDPEYVKPVLLKADEGKTTPIEERIARAKNRGVFGFSIGEDIERSPHFRRPHFAIRWTGKGAEIPKLVPVKGAIIGKEIMTTVPTGYEGQTNERL